MRSVGMRLSAGIVLSAYRVRPVGPPATHRIPQEGVWTLVRRRALELGSCLSWVSKQALGHQISLSRHPGSRSLQAVFPSGMLSLVTNMGPPGGG